MELHKKPIYELAHHLKNKDISSLELTEVYLERTGAYQQELNAFITVTAVEARKMALEAQKTLDEGKGTPLTGIPMAFKDNMCTKGVKTTCASHMLDQFIPPYDATVVKRLHSEGTVMLGKLNMDEFAMGSTNENSFFGVVHNPWDKDRVSGGSSGGSAASVSAGLVPFSLGSDTGGSIRLPASFCGVVGMKPTYGAVSRFGLVAFASSLDQIGPLTTNVRDCAIVLDAIMGHDPMDSTSAPVVHEKCSEDLRADVNHMSFGLAKEYFGHGLDQEIKDAVMKVVRVLEDAGAVSDTCSIPATEYGISAYYLLSSAEASANLARYDGIRYGHRSERATDVKELYKLTRGEGFGKEVKNRILLGTHALSSGYHDALYVKALKVRRMIHDDFLKAFEKHDILVSPVAPNTAFRIGEKTTDPLAMYLADVYTVAVNLAGLPALVVPCGLDSCGMPIGVQLIGKPFSEKKLLQAGLVIEEVMGRLSSPMMNKTSSAKGAIA